MGVAAPTTPGGLRRGGSRNALAAVGALPVAALLAALAILAALVGTGVVAPSSRCGTGGGGGSLPGTSSAPGSLGGVAGTGLTRAQILAVRRHGGGPPMVTPGTYSTTAYGPPWGGIQGSGASTAGGVVLNGGSPRYYMVAVDPTVVRLGSLLYAWPNPFHWRGPFLAADVGGAIDARELDFYDWRGRSVQYGWGRQDAKVSDRPLNGAAGDEDVGEEPVGDDVDPNSPAPDFAAAEVAARSTGGHPVGFAIADTDGRLVASVGAGRPNLGRSMSRALVLVALARTAARRELSSAEQSQAAAMIQRSDNAAASSLYGQVGAGAVDRTARAAGMTGWRRDTSDPVYTLGESMVTAGDFAKLFARLDALLPRRHREWATGLLASIEGPGRYGLLSAGLPGRVLSKGGWSPEGARGWTVNQAGRVELGGKQYGIAVVLGGQPSFEAGRRAIQRIAEKIAAAGVTAAGACGGGGGGFTATGPLGERIGQIARSHLGQGGTIAGFTPPSGPGGLWCAWFAINVWQKAGVPIAYSGASNFPYHWAQPRHQLFKQDGRPPKGPTPPQGSAIMYGIGPQDTNSSWHVNLVDKVNRDGSFMITGGNQGGGRVTRQGPCRMSVATPAHMIGPGCDGRDIYGIAVPSTAGV